MFAKCFLYMVTHANIQVFWLPYLLKNYYTLNVPIRNLPKLFFLCSSCLRSIGYSCLIVELPKLNIPLL